MGDGVHIMAINETKFSNTAPDCLVSIKDFALERKDRNVYGGRVTLYLQNTTSNKVIDTLSQQLLELLCTEVIPKHVKPFFVVSWYRPPDSMVDRFQDLENAVSYLETF